MQFIEVLPEEAETRLRAQAQHLADIADLALLHNEISQRAPGYRFKFLPNWNLRPLHRHRGVRCRLQPDAQTAIKEIRIRAATLPHPRTADYRVVHPWVAVNE